MYHKTHWTADKIAGRLALIDPLVHRRTAPLPDFRMLELPDPMTLPPIGSSVDRSGWKTIEAKTHWGRRYMDFVMHTTFVAPPDWEADRPVALYLPLGNAGDFSHPEALAYVDGVVCGTCDRHHQEFMLPAALRDGRTHALDLHGWTGLIEAESLAFDPGLFMKTCAVVQIDQPTRDFIALARITLETATKIDANEPAKGHLFNALDAAFKVLDTRDPLGEAFYASVPAAHATLQEGIAKAGPSLDVEVIGTGHAHIDVAWLWTLGQTRRKAGRTFTTVQRLMEQFPEYHFTQSQPQLYDYVRQDYPALFEAIKARVAEGRWEPIGGMWVEADCNLSGPESLARQFLLGRTFFRKHFGAAADTRVLWLPDVFGYAWNLPQLIKEAGLRLLLHDQDRLEPVQSPALRFLLVAGPGRHQGAHAFQHDTRPGLVCQHLQCHGERRPKSWHMDQLSAKRIAAEPAHGLWLWRWRRRANARDAGKHPCHGGFPRPAQDAQRVGQRVL